MIGVLIIVLFPVDLIGWLATGLPALVKLDLVFGLLCLGIFPSFIYIDF
jgi:hypothetical protein